MDVSLRQLVPSDLERLADIRRFAYSDRSDYSDPDVRAHHLRYLKYRTGAFVDGELAATASWLPISMFVAHEAREVVGLASVATGAEWRRRGLVRSLLRAGLERLKSDEIGWCLEYPFDARYYAKFGWETLPWGVVVNVPCELFPSGDAPPRAQAFRFGDHSCAVSIYDRWATNYSLMSTRKEPFRDVWRNLLEGPVWNRSPAFGFEVDGGYFIARIRADGGEQQLVLYDWAFDSPAGRANLLALIATYCGQVDTVKIQLPLDDPLAAEWQPWAVANHDIPQARIVSVRHALEGLPVTSPVDVVIEVADDFAEWNTGRWHIQSTAGQLSVSATDAEPVLRSDIRGLASIAAGGIKASRAWRIGSVRGDLDAARQLDRLDLPPTHSSWADYF